MPANFELDYLCSVDLCDEDTEFIAFDPLGHLVGFCEHHASRNILMELLTIDEALDVGLIDESWFQDHETDPNDIIWEYEDKS